MSVLDSLDYNIQYLENLKSKVDVFNTTLSMLNTQKVDLENKQSLVSSSREYYTKAVDIIYKESLGALKTTLNMAVKYIMYDKNYSVDLVLEDKRGTKNLSIKLVDEDEGFEVGLKHGCGQGIRTIISSVLKVYYLLNQGSKILLLDEKYSALSSAYIQRFFEFLHKLTEEHGMIIVMITHDERFTIYSDKSFLVNDGKLVNVEEAVQEIKESEVE